MKKYFPKGDVPKWCVDALHVAGIDLCRVCCSNRGDDGLDVDVFVVRLLRIERNQLMKAVEVDHRLSLLADRHAGRERHVIGNVGPHVAVARLERSAGHRLRPFDHHHDLDVVGYQEIADGGFGEAGFGGIGPIGQ